MAQKTEAELLKEQIIDGRLPTPEEAKRYYDDRMQNQPPPGADSTGKINIFKKGEVPADIFDFEIIPEEDPADISDINDWDHI